ncbi:MAG: hypothetical protein M3Q95_08220 [Bacteroidota bacterium]|nr:hypothetical protein [Bacteroidota bacterium]
MRAMKNALCFQIIIINLLTLLFLRVSICNAQEDNYSDGLKAFDAKEYGKAVQLLKPFADSGKCLAQYAVGFSYTNSELSIANDSLAEYYLLLASEQKQTHAMGVLATVYFEKSYTDKSYNIKALVWAELAAAYDIIQFGLSTRYVIRAYMEKADIKEAEKLIEIKKSELNKMKSCD